MSQDISGQSVLQDSATPHPVMNRSPPSHTLRPNSPLLKSKSHDVPAHMVEHIPSSESHPYGALSPPSQPEPSHDVPAQRVEHVARIDPSQWNPMELSPSLQHDIEKTFEGSPSQPEVSNCTI
jgi:hypothetical protein